jgi:hypothetical protein
VPTFYYARIVMPKVVDADRFRAGTARTTGGSGGGNMDDVLRRLGVVENLLAETREVVSAIKTAVLHLATKAEVNDLKAGVSSIDATLPHLASKADLNALETKIIRWLVGTLLAAVTAAFTIAKFVH